MKWLSAFFLSATLLLSGLQLCIAGESSGTTADKRVFGLVIDFGTSQSPKSTRPLTTYWCPSPVSYTHLTLPTRLSV